MTAIAFDTLKTARALESKGFSREQSEALAEQLAESRSIDLSHVATQDDLLTTRDELKREIGELGSSLRGEIGELRLSLKGEIAEVKAGLKVEIAEAKADLLKVIITVAVLNVATVIGAMVGLAKLLGH